ncbi:MAG: flagellar motor protein MotB [Treponema sp.]|jgi:chemotaxis protein MotB|nr:flagellar motor protein MotB [Treponema sp.]
MARKKKQQEEQKGEWIVTYSDMVTLLLCFFVALFNASDADPAQMAQMISALNNMGLGGNSGGNTLSSGTSADLGNTIMSLPAMSRGQSLGDALKRAVSLFQPEIRSNKVKISHDERGLVISLAGDIFFNEASARINIEESRDILLRVATLLVSLETSNTPVENPNSNLQNRRFRIEGHTDDRPADPYGPWGNNWTLSTERSIAVLQYLSTLGVNERFFQVAGFSQYSPIGTNETPEGRKFNRRVDIVVLDPGHL